MRYMVKFKIAIDAGNAALRDPEFGAKMKQYLTEVKAEASYFTSMNGQRGGYIVLDVNQASEIPAIAEPLFLWLHADVEFLPVMAPDDLAKAGPAIAAAVQKWG
jgi:hypothetical protein